MWSCCGWNVVYESFLGSIPTDYRFNFALKYDFKSKRERLSVRFLSKYSLVCTHIHEKDFTGSWFFHVEYTLGRHGRSTKLIHQDGAETYMSLAKSFVEVATQTYMHMIILRLTWRMRMIVERCRAQVLWEHHMSHVPYWRRARALPP